ncbi:MAG: type II secretion system F family protein [Acetobacteraceae bacterium]
MTLGPLQLFLLIGATLSLIGLAVSGLMVSRAQAERDRLRRRVSSVVTQHTRHARVEISAFTAAEPRRGNSPLSGFARLFGFDPEKTALYPIKWWIVLSVALVLAKLIQNLTSEFMGGTFSWVALPIVWVMLCRNYFAWIENRRRSQLLQQFPDALAMIVRAIRVGIPVMEAIRIVSRESEGPTAGEFARLVDMVAIGTTLEDGVTELARRSGLPEYRFFATALSLQNQTGGTLSDTLENLADVIRKRAALKARGKALTSESRASASILAVLPFGTGAMLYLINPEYIGLLFTHPTGQSMLGGAVVSLALGLFTIRTIIRKSLPQ